MIQAIQLKKKTFIELDSAIYRVLDHHHVKPGKGGALVKAKLKCLSKPMIITKTFRSDEKLKEIHLEHTTVEFLYSTNEEAIFMNSSNHEQYEIQLDKLENEINFLKSGLEMSISFYNGEIIDINLPSSVELEVTYTEPAIKGNTVTNTMKDATVETGYQLKVPLFINKHDIVKVDTETGNYMTRTATGSEN